MELTGGLQQGLRVWCSGATAGASTERRRRGCGSLWCQTEEMMMHGRICTGMGGAWASMEERGARGLVAVAAAME